MPFYLTQTNAGIGILDSFAEVGLHVFHKHVQKVSIRNISAAVPVIVIDQQPPKSLQGYKDKPISLQCRASSKRGPVTYQWFRNKKRK